MLKKIFKNSKIFTSPRKPWIYFYVIIPAVILNLLFSYFNNTVLEFPLFLDSIFTAVAAVLLGPAVGVLTGLLTNIGMEFQYGMTGLYWPFAICNMATGFIVGFLHKKGYFENILQMSIAVLLVALVNAFLGAIVAYLLFEGDSGVVIDTVVNALIHMGQTMSSAVFWARVPANLADKLIAVLAAYSLNKLIFQKDKESEYLLTKKHKN
jgi:energy-coupling factor transport system substrate-specific component